MVLMTLSSSVRVCGAVEGVVLFVFGLFAVPCAYICVVVLLALVQALTNRTS